MGTRGTGMCYSRQKGSGLPKDPVQAHLQGSRSSATSAHYENKNRQRRWVAACLLKSIVPSNLLNLLPFAVDFLRWHELGGLLCFGMRRQRILLQGPKCSSDPGIPQRCTQSNVRPLPLISLIPGVLIVIMVRGTREPQRAG
eukprot:3927047-Rhodomonas_salina.2